MENQHRKISGYRELNQTEINLMNEIKEKGKELEELIKKVDKQNSTLGIKERIDSECRRWENIAKTHLQQGIMALTRAVAKPKFF